MAEFFRGGALRALEQLGAEGNGIGDEGMVAVAAAVEESLPKLDALFLSRNVATETGHRAVAAACARRAPKVDLYLDLYQL